eukprot:TRINITY_DN22143_c0_g1_i1.p1 TRINITY_DN22143_c0_g1~~TRINITY_DN22143_c0_g1_i1.p1  ORF type:complete len:365 (-),score=66.43 TRINITY_DN22143_c0_g1_i1:15-977(-)
MEKLVPDSKWMRFGDIIDNFAKGMLMQCDLAAEAENLLTFTKNFAHAESIRFPVPIPEYVHELVLVETFEQGKPVKEYIRDCFRTKSASEITNDSKEVAKLGLYSYLQMILVDNFVHADLHPGNILVFNQDMTTPVDPNHLWQPLHESQGVFNTVVNYFRKKRDKPYVVLLDCGLVTKLSQQDKENFVNLLQSLISRDSKLAATLITAGQDHLTPQQIDAFASDLEDVMQFFMTSSLADVRLAAMFLDVLKLARKHRVVLESNYTTLIVGTIVVEGIGRRLDPDLNLIEVAKPLLLQSPELRKIAFKEKLRWLKSRVKKN